MRAILKSQARRPELGRFGHSGPRDAEEDLLRQIAGSLRRADDPPEIAKDAVPMVGIEAFDVRHACDSNGKNTGGE